jgi:hypothetical protein
MVRAYPLLPVALALFVTASAGCGHAVDLTRALVVEDVSTGWHDAGLVDGNNKLVPSVSFKLKNMSDQKLVTLAVNVMFRRGTATEEWGSGFKIAAGSEGLAPGSITDSIVVHSPRGYTGTEARADMLKNSQFVDAKVELFAKYAANSWQRLGEYQVTRELLAQ